jgi:circadian clock protein KaiC
LAAKRKAIDAQIAALRAEAETEEAEVKFAIAQETHQAKVSRQNAEAIAHLRGESTGSKSKPKAKS